MHFLTQSQENCSFFYAKSSLVTKYAKIVTKKSTHIRMLPLFSLQPVRASGSPMDVLSPSRQGDSVYTLSEAYFGEWVPQNPSSRGRVTPKGIYAICIVPRA